MEHKRILKANKIIIKKKRKQRANLKKITKKYNTIRIMILICQKKNSIINKLKINKSMLRLLNYKKTRLK